MAAILDKGFSRNALSNQQLSEQQLSEQQLSDNQLSDNAVSDHGMSDMGKKQDNGSAYDQASAVAYRCQGDALELCLITSSGKKRWCFPKGIIEGGETPGETALKEADEEAGVRGEIVGLPLGSYRYRKWGRWLTVQVLLMRVDAVADTWREADLRQRRWVSFEEAMELLDRADLRQFVAIAAKQLGVALDSERVAKQAS